ncbi:hypothetical protein [Acetivibrio ethanolgignens]|uniref:Uncharacterized protein n=1 Tax=Acetivibrio ethanolgignens TaxID=290052 RepID=A0A0V8QGE2_9FIRM|nr:hypothetical protein [Acetivibrio ethanolgignens]KSV59475.1 hypothetical protein ASU35_08645 [Acetivibrio ethanolgignens]
MLESKILILILIINTLLALLHFLYQGILKGNYRKGAFIGLFILFVPGVGAVFLAGAQMLNFLFFHGNETELNEDELGFCKKKGRTIISDDIEKAENIVPIDEALRISDSIDKRQAFLEVLKRDDAENYMAKIQEAMKQKDTEVVHYAASYISDTIVKYKESERNLRLLCDKEEDPEILLRYLRLCADILQKNIFSGTERQMYVGNFEKYMELLYQLNPGEIDGIKISQMISLEKEGKNNIAVERWVSRAEQIMEKDIDAAKEVLKYYFYTKDTQNFEKAMDIIKSSELELDSELIGWIRFYTS